MQRLMRNVHLGLGLVFLLMTLVFAVSSLVIIYRPWLGRGIERSEFTVQLSPASDARTAARELMTGHAIRGDLRQIREQRDAITFQIVRPGQTAAVTYTAASGAAALVVTRQGTLETLVQLHTNHGFWHDYMPSNLWAALSLLGSVGLLLLGVSGLYLWFVRYRHRWMGGLLLGFGLVYGGVTLVLTRLQQ